MQYRLAPPFCRPWTPRDGKPICQVGTGYSQSLASGIPILPSTCTERA